MRERRAGVPVVAVTVAVVAAMAAACASMPTGGAVHLGRALPRAAGLGDLDVRALPPSWQPRLGPQEVVNGFLRALVNDDDDYAVARSFLTVAASASWRANVGVTTYDESGLRETQPPDAAPPQVTLQLRAPRVGRIDERGDYTAAAGTLTATFVVVKQGTNGWRIERLPNGVILSASDAQRAFRPGDVYYFNRARNRLVPEQILLRSESRGTATALVAALVAGPGEWLAPAVRSAVPRGTGLIGNVPVHDNGVADVNLSAPVRLASSADLAALSAQLVWTLRQVSGVAAVRLLAEGTPLSAPGLMQRTPVTAWAKYDPAGPSSTRDLLYVHAGHLATTGDDSLLRRSDPGGAVSVARSPDGQTLAVVRRFHRQLQLLTGRLGGQLRARLAALSITPPSFDASGDVVAAVTTREGTHVVSVDVAGRTRVVSSDPRVVSAGVRALRFAGDGARVAVVSADGRLLVGRVVGSPDGEGLDAFREVTPTLRDVRGVAWTDADTLALTAAGAGGSRRILEVDVAGYTMREVAGYGLRGVAVDVAGAPDAPLAVATDAGVIWVDVEADGWRQVGAGAAPVHSG